MASLSRGQKTKLGDLTPALQLEAGIGAAGPCLTFDISCFGLDGEGKLSDDRYFVFYNQTQSPEGALQLLGGAGGDTQRFALDLARLPQSVRRLVFVVTLDGNGTMSQLQSGHFRLSANGGEVARFDFSGRDFATEKAIMAAEVYFKDVWRAAAVGQGFAGGLSAVLQHFGGEEASEEVPAAPPVVPQPVPVAPPAPAVNLKKIDLEKKMEREAPQLLSLAKKAQISLEKVNLGNHAARVALCLDISGSMFSLYRSGKIQRFAEKVLALGTRFDDDGAIDIFLFGAKAHDVGEMSTGNFNGFVGNVLKLHPLEGGTYYGRAIQMIRRHYFPDAKGGERQKPCADKLPVYVMFLTDGQTLDADTTRQQLRWAAYEPIFWQFMGIGKSNRDLKKRKGFLAKLAASDFDFLESLDELSGRYVDNANFFSVEDPETVADEELYDLLMSEYPGWVKQAPGLGLLR